MHLLQQFFFFQKTSFAKQNRFFSGGSRGRRLEYVRLKHVMSELLRHAKKHSFGRLFHDDETSKVHVIEKYASRTHHSF
jgi:hypothetical protein